MKYDSKNDTLEHIEKVRKYINIIIDELKNRAEKHDSSKLSGIEKDIFDIYTPKLRNTTYGSDEYKKYLSEMKVGLDRHYNMNKHHPEYWKNGINDMSLVDIIEMICDWKAATERHNDGNIMNSLIINQKRFGYDDSLRNLLEKTVKHYFE